MTDTNTAEPSQTTSQTTSQEHAPAAAPAPGGRRRKRRARVRRRRARYGITGVDRVNRCVLGLIGLVLIVAGGIGLLAEDRLDVMQPGRMYRDSVTEVTDGRALALIIVLIAAVVLVLVGLRWSWAQVSPASGDGRISTTTVARTTQGRTTIEPVSMAKALASDIETVEGVTRAAVRVISIGSRPDVVATVAVRRDADLRRVRRDLGAPLDRFMAATATHELDAEVRLRVVGEDGPRVG